MTAGDEAIYDKAAWHRDDAIFVRGELPPERAGTHIALYRTWMVLRGLADPAWTAEFRDTCLALQARRIGPAACEPPGEASIGGEDFSAEGRAFTDWYYARHYAEDIQRHLTKRLPSVYHVPDDWPAFETLARVLDTRLDDFRAQRERGDPLPSFAENMFARVGRVRDVEREGRREAEDLAETAGGAHRSVRWSVMPWLWLVPVAILGALTFVFSHPSEIILEGAVVGLVIYTIWKTFDIIRRRPGA